MSPSAAFPLFQRLTGHTSAVEAVTFDGNEATVVGGSASGTLKLWDLSTGKSKYRKIM